MIIIERELNVYMSAEVLGVALRLCQGNKQYEDLKHIRVIQIQQACQESVDSGEPCQGGVRRHRGQLMLGAQWKPGCRTATLSAQGCSELESLRSSPAVTSKVMVSTRVKHSDDMQWRGLISSSEGNCAYSFVSTEHGETGTLREHIMGKGQSQG